MIISCIFLETCFQINIKQFFNNIGDKIKVVIDSDDLEKYALKESLYLNLLLINDTIYSREKIIACSRSTFFTEIVSSSLPVRYQIQGIDLNGIPFKTIILDDYVTYEGGICIENNAFIIAANVNTNI